jgi:hypothetical protein
MFSQQKHAFWLFLVFLLFSLSSTASETVDKERLDGTTIEAVETYIHPRHSSFIVGAGIFPMDPFFYGFSVNGSYTYFFNGGIGWEILQGNYIFSVNKDLASQLAALGQTASLEKLQYLASTNLVLVPAYGKTVLFSNFIQYFRICILLGPAMIKTSLISTVGVGAGLRFESNINRIFSWNIEVRDTFTIDGSRNFLAFTFGTGLNF